MEGENLYMKNSSTFKVLGVSKVILKMTSRKLLVLNNKLHVAEIRKNSMCNSFLSKNSFIIIFKSDNFFLFKSGMFIKNCILVMASLQ